MAFMVILWHHTDKFRTLCKMQAIGLDFLEMNFFPVEVSERSFSAAFLV
jgi:hypothetical protein